MIPNIRIIPKNPMVRPTKNHITILKIYKKFGIVLPIVVYSVQRSQQLLTVVD